MTCETLSVSAVMSSGTTPRDEKIGDIKSLLKLKKKYDAPEVSELPESYRTNTEKEKLWLWCANNMQRQIKFDFPHLRPLCVAPENECGVKKLICTFIKVLKIILLRCIYTQSFYIQPTVVPYSHLYDVDECSKFIADFIYYSPERSVLIPHLLRM